MAESLHVRGLTEFLKALGKADKETKKIVRARLRKAAEPVRRDAIRRFSSIDARSARSYRTVVRARGISVEQSKRKTTGKHPEYGALQMDVALIPALEANRGRVNHELEQAADDIADIVRRV